MSIVRITRATDLGEVLFDLGLIGVAVGCDEGKPPGPEQFQRLDRGEQRRRRRAFGRLFEAAAQLALTTSGRAWPSSSAARAVFVQS
jgi:hypothetical protein